MVSKKIVKLVVAKLSLATIVTFCCLTYRNHDFIRRSMNNISLRDIQIQRGYFQDPNGLEVYHTINSDGSREVYLRHRPSDTRIPIKEDLYPDSMSMLEHLLERSQEFTQQEAKQYLLLLNQIQESIYERL